MFVQQRLFDMYSEPRENHDSKEKSSKAFQDNKRIVAPLDPRRRRKGSHWKLVGLMWQKIIFFANLYAALGKIVSLFGPISKDWWAQNLISMAVSIAATAIVIELGTRNHLLVRKLYRVAINVIEKRRGRIQR